MFLEHEREPGLARSTLVILLLGAAACTADTVSPDGGTTAADAAVGADAEPARDQVGPAPDAEVGPDVPTTPGLARSEKARVRWKGEPLLHSEFAAALGLAPADVCKELGNYDCFNVHRIALGGVEPYTLGINEPFPDTAVTAPLAIERVALSGCRTRIDQDLAQPAQAQIFKGLTTDAVDVRTPEARAVVDQLYARFQSRRATPAEVDALLALYADVTTAGEARPGRAWAILACFAVATSVESLFY